MGSAEFMKSVPPASDVAARKAYLRRSGYTTQNSPDGGQVPRRPGEVVRPGKGQGNQIR